MAYPETISSAANPLIKDVRRAIAHCGLTSDGWCVAETFHLLEEALRSRCEIQVVLAAESACEAVTRLAGGGRDIRLVALPDRLMNSLSSTENSQGVMALMRPPEWAAEDLFRGCPLVVVLDRLQDPGNVGAIARAAEAFGATGMIWVKGTASPYNPKTLRASAGSLFRVPVRFGVDPATARALLKEHSVASYAAVPADGRAPAALDLRGPCALIIGSEAHGVEPELRSAAQSVSISTVAVESLNAAVAAGILLYEARRQRTARA